MENQNNTETLSNEPQWSFVDDTEKSFGIETKTYTNGQVMKRAKLSDGRIAVSRRLKGKDSKQISRLSDGDDEKYKNAIIVLSVKIDDKDIMIEDLEEMWLKDVTLLTMLASTNFPSAQNG